MLNWGSNSHEHEVKIHYFYKYFCTMIGMHLANRLGIQQTDLFVKDIISLRFLKVGIQVFDSKQKKILLNKTKTKQKKTNNKKQKQKTEQNKTHCA